MNVASNWTGDALPQDGDTLDMSILTSPSSMYVGDFGDERRFETMTLWRTKNQLVLREGTLRLQYLTYSSGSIFGLSSEVVLDVSGKIKSTGNRCFAGCGTGTVIAGEIENAGENAFMCASSPSSGGLVVKTGKFTISNSGYLSLSSAGNNSSYGLNYVVGAGGLSFGDGATSSAFYQNANKNIVRIDPSADYTLAANSARESEVGDNLAFMCHESTTYFGTTDYYDNTQPRTVTFAGGIGADSTSGRNVIVDGIGTLVFNACKSGSHEFNGALTVKNTATLLLRDTAAPGKGTKTFESGTTFKVEQTSPTGIVTLKDSLTLAANSTLEFVLAANATTSALRVATLTLPASGTVKVKLSDATPGRYLLVENLPSGTTADKFTAVYDSNGAYIVSLYVEDDRLMAVVSKKAIWKSNVEGNMSDSTKWVDDYVPQDGDTPDLRVIASSQKNVYIPDFGDDRRFETLLHNGNIMLRSADGPATNMLRLAFLTYSAGSTFGLGGAAGLDVAGKLKFTGDSKCFGGCGAVVIKADEFEQAGQPAFICSSSAFATPLGVTVRKFTISGSTLYLTTAVINNGYGVKYVVGSGGFTFAEGCTASAYYAVRYATNSARIDPSADYSIGVNPLNANNYSFRNLSSTAYFGTTDANDHETPRTVTCDGGIGGESSDANANMYVDGNGTFVFNSATGTYRYPGKLSVRDTATLLLRDTATTGIGPMTFNAGTTFKIEQTSANGIVELGGALTLAANSTLEFDLAENSATSALRVASLTMPASGKVRVKASGVSRGGRAVLIDNLPAGIRANQFEFVEKPYGNATLVVSGNKLMVEKSKGLVVIIAGGKSASPAPVTAKILFAGDSTLDDYGRVVNPFASWGTTLEDFMRSGCSVDNYAKSGASTKSFRANGYWGSLLAAIRPGDFVGIQFGHNDQKAGSNFAAPDGLFRDNVRQFVSEVRALGGKPILLSPIVRGTFDDGGNLYEAQLDNGTRLSQYATAMRELSVELGTDFVDMNALTHDLLVELGKAESAKLFADSAGKSGDYTHPIPAGADAFARLFVKNVKDRGLEVAALFT
jgi:lysophospholipase L1-like esterase